MPSQQQPGSRQWADGLDPAAAGAAPGCPLWRCVGLCCRGVGTPHSQPGRLLPPRTICLIFVSLLLLLVAVLGSAVLYAQHYDQELLYWLLLRVLPQAMYASLAYFASRSLRVVCDGLLPI